MILTIEESRDVLRVDGDENDPIILSLLNSIPAYLETATGSQWDVEPIHPLAKTTAGFILQLWFDPQDQNTDRLKKTIDTLLASLTVIGRNRSD